MKKWPFEQFQHDPRIADGVYVGQRSTPVSLHNYVKYLKERAASETAPWVIFMSDVFDLYPELRRVTSDSRFRNNLGSILFPGPFHLAEGEQGERK